MEERVNIWFDEEGDFLEIMFGRGKEKGFFRDIGDDIWERVDEKGKIRGLAILNFRKRAEKGEIELPYRLNLSKSV
ncbi:MAG: DUF2283 domain-containing protein [Euryarchaeota archaeon]|nr:DUF2283 domain-containing protein [Euryarchaeota archaeon]